MTKCEHCGREITQTVRTKRFCDKKCRDNWHYARKRHKYGRKPMPAKKNCDECGNEYQPTGKIQRFCSPKCRRDKYRVERAEYNRRYYVNHKAPMRKRQALRKLEEERRTNGDRQGSIVMRELRPKIRAIPKACEVLQPALQSGRI